MSRSWIETKMEFVPKTGCIMTPYSLAPVQIFSSLFSIHTVWYCQGNLFDNQQLYNLMIISFIPMILMFGSAVIRWGEIKCQTLLGVKGLKNTSHLAPNLPSPTLSKKKQFHWSLQFVAYNYVELSISISQITQNFFHSQKSCRNVNVSFFWLIESFKMRLILVAIILFGNSSIGRYNNRIIVPNVNKILTTC